MDAAGVTDIDDAALDAMSGTAVGCAPVNGVGVVWAPAGRVLLLELIAHPGGCGAGLLVAELLLGMTRLVKDGGEVGLPTRASRE